jgi:cardiolipin synthase
MAEQSTAAPGEAAAPICATLEGNRLALIESGKGRLQALLELIRGAEKSLRLLFYIFAADRSGTLVRDALTEAARRGVRVRLLLDGFGCADTDPAFFKPVQEEGGHFCLFHPSYGRRYLLRNHQKLAIADERRALIGGGNVEDSYMEDEGAAHWRDLWLSIDGPSVPAAARYFDDLYRWTTTKGAKLRRLRRLVHEHSQFRGRLQWKFTSPLSTRNPWRSAIARDIAKAGQVDIIAAYFAPPRSMIRRLARAAGRGRVRVITASRSDNHATVAAARYTYSRLLRRSVEMYEYVPARLHTKLVIVDDVVYIGSANFDFRSFYINLEVMLRIEDSRFADAMRGYLKRELADSERITQALHRRRATLWRRFRWTVSHFLVTSMDYSVSRRLNFGPER